jgi:hypothetical protein
MARQRTVTAQPPTPELLADVYLLPMARSGDSGSVRWMPDRDVCLGSFDFDVCALFCLFQGRPDIVWHVTTTAATWAGFNEWLAIAGRHALERAQSRLYDVLYGTGELVRPGRFDCVTSRTPQVQAVCEFGAPRIDCELHHRPGRLHWRQRVLQHVWVPWPLCNVRMEVV